MDESDLAPHLAPAIVTIGGDWAELRRYERVADIPTRTLAVVVFASQRKASTLPALRKRLPGGRLIAHFDTADQAASDAALRDGYDAVTSGTAQLQRTIETLDRDLRVKMACEVRLDTFHSLQLLIEEMAKNPGLPDVFRVAVIRMRELFDIDQVSVVLFHPPDTHATVVFDSGTGVDNIVIAVDAYPELQEVMRRREPLVIADLLGDELMQGVRAQIQEAKVVHRSALLFPLMRDGEPFGVLFLRDRRTAPIFEQHLLNTGKAVATVTALAVGSAIEEDKLTSTTHVLIKQQQRTDQLLESLGNFARLFEQAHDGIVLTDLAGVIEYANHAAKQLLGDATLEGRNFLDLLNPRYKRLAERAFAGDGMGDGTGYVDLLVSTAGETAAVLSAAIQRTTDPEGVLVSFRDVTELREIESELRQTKEFLENLIQSSVDGIVAIDIDSGIILLNRAAEEMLSYSARDAIGRMSLDQLMPEGEAEDVWRRLRSEAFGGRGRVTILRKTLLARGGEALPVNLSAAIIYEGGEEIAAVIIFTDLRERLHIEEKLNAVQEQLRVSERRSVAIELAGVAAHELNQPLTSILGYAEILKRRIDDDERLRKPVDVICKQTERMAEIVRRLGQITDYRSKSYVGGSRILDIGADGGADKAADVVPPSDKKEPAS